MILLCAVCPRAMILRLLSAVLLASCCSLGAASPISNATAFCDTLTSSACTVSTSKLLDCSHNNCTFSYQVALNVLADVACATPFPAVHADAGCSVLLQSTVSILVNQSTMVAQVIQLGAPSVVIGVTGVLNTSAQGWAAGAGAPAWIANGASNAGSGGWAPCSQHASSSANCCPGSNSKERYYSATLTPIGTPLAPWNDFPGIGAGTFGLLEAQGARGGGAVNITGRSVLIMGTVLAEGGVAGRLGHGTLSAVHGAGAGGSIVLFATTLTGGSQASVSVRGGQGWSGGLSDTAGTADDDTVSGLMAGSGGGGRIAAVASSLSLSLGSVQFNAGPFVPAVASTAAACGLGSSGIAVLVKADGYALASSLAALDALPREVHMSNSDLLSFAATTLDVQVSDSVASFNLAYQALLSTSVLSITQSGPTFTAPGLSVSQSQVLPKSAVSETAPQNISINVPLAAINLLGGSTIWSLGDAVYLYAQSINLQSGATAAFIDASGPVVLFARQALSVQGNIKPLFSATPSNVFLWAGSSLSVTSGSVYGAAVGLYSAGNVSVIGNVDSQPPSRIACAFPIVRRANCEDLSWPVMKSGGQNPFGPPSLGNYSIVMHAGAQLSVAGSSPSLDSDRRLGGASGMSITAGALCAPVMQVAGAITASAEGCEAGSGPGAGGCASSCTSGGGAGHGGAGGVAADGSPGGRAYGLAAMPLYSGSGGGSQASTGGSGGGYLRLEGAHVQLQANVAADGGDSEAAGGGGAGGSVVIIANVVSGHGAVSAQGGSGSLGGGGGGGGGRISFMAPTAPPAPNPSSWSHTVAALMAVGEHQLARYAAATACAAEHAALAAARPVRLMALDSALSRAHTSLQALSALTGSSIVAQFQGQVLLQGGKAGSSWGYPGGNGTLYAPPCAPGFGGLHCTTCPIGTFKSSPGIQPCSPCTNKPAEATYTETGSVSSSCPYECDAGRRPPHCYTPWQEAVESFGGVVGLASALLATVLGCTGGVLLIQRRHARRLLLSDLERSRSTLSAPASTWASAKSSPQLPGPDFGGRGPPQAGAARKRDTPTLNTPLLASQLQGQSGDELRDRVWDKLRATYGLEYSSQRGTPSEASMSELRADPLNSASFDSMSVASSSGPPRQVERVAELVQTRVRTLRQQERARRGCFRYCRGVRGADSGKHASLQSLLALQDADTQFLVLRLHFAGLNAPGEPWRLPTQAPPALQQFVQPAAWTELATELNALLDWSNSAWDARAMRVLRVFCAPLAHVLLDQGAELRAERLLSAVASADSTFLSGTLAAALGESLRVSIAGDYSAAALDFLWKEREPAPGPSPLFMSASSDAGSFPSIARSASALSVHHTVQLPLMIRLAGRGTFAHPYYLDSCDALVRGISAARGVSAFIHDSWLNFVAHFNMRARIVRRRAFESTAAPLLTFLAWVNAVSAAAGTGQTAVAAGTQGAPASLVLGGLQVRLAWMWPCAQPDSAEQFHSAGSRVSQRAAQLGIIVTLCPMLAQASAAGALAAQEDRAPEASPDLTALPARLPVVRVARAGPTDTASAGSGPAYSRAAMRAHHARVAKAGTSAAEQPQGAQASHQRSTPLKIMASKSKGLAPLSVKSLQSPPALALTDSVGPLSDVWLPFPGARLTSFLQGPRVVPRHEISCAQRAVAALCCWAPARPGSQGAAAAAGFHLGGDILDKRLNMHLPVPGVVISVEGVDAQRAVAVVAHGPNAGVLGNVAEAKELPRHAPSLRKYAHALEMWGVGAPVWVQREVLSELPYVHPAALSSMMCCGGEYSQQCCARLCGGNWMCCATNVPNDNLAALPKPWCGKPARVRSHQLARAPQVQTGPGLGGVRPAPTRSRAGSGLGIAMPGVDSAAQLGHRAAGSLRLGHSSGLSSGSPRHAPVPMWGDAGLNVPAQVRVVSSQAVPPPTGVHLYLCCTQRVPLAVRSVMWRRVMPLRHRCNARLISLVLGLALLVDLFCFGGIMLELGCLTKPAVFFPEHAAVVNRTQPPTVSPMLGDSLSSVLHSHGMAPGLATCESAATLSQQSPAGLMHTPVLLDVTAVGSTANSSAGNTTLPNGELGACFWEFLPVVVSVPPGAVLAPFFGLAMLLSQTPDAAVAWARWNAASMISVLVSAAITLLVSRQLSWAAMALPWGWLASKILAAITMPVLLAQAELNSSPGAGWSGMVEVQKYGYAGHRAGPI